MTKPASTLGELADELAMDPADVALVAGWLGARRESDVDEALCAEVREYVDHLFVRAVPTFWWPVRE